MSPGDTLCFLEEQRPEDIYLIRFFVQHLDRILKEKRGASDQAEWEEFVDFMVKNLDLPNLSLPLDVGQMHD